MQKREGGKKKGKRMSVRWGWQGKGGGVRSEERERERERAERRLKREEEGYLERRYSSRGMPSR
jgi:hypothetical protein